MGMCKLTAVSTRTGEVTATEYKIDFGLKDSNQSQKSIYELYIESTGKQKGDLKTQDISKQNDV